MNYQKEQSEKEFNRIIERGRMAELLLSLPEFHRFFEEVRDDYFRNFYITHPTLPDEVLAYQHQAHALWRIQQKAELYVSDAKGVLEKRSQGQS